MTMTRDQIVEWARTFIDAQQDEAIDADHPSWWAIEDFMDGAESSVEDRWSAILEVLTRTMNVFGSLAAGPLEDLIADHGAKMIDAVELEASQNIFFRLLLDGVWRRGGSEDIWARVQQLRLGAIGKLQPR